MNTSSICRALSLLFKHSNIGINHYVIAADEIGKVSYSKFPIGIVQNTDVAGEPGEHWIAYYCINKDEYDYYDSYGNSLSSYEEVMPPIGRLNAENCSAQQLPSSFICGMYAIYFIYCRSIGIGYAEFIDLFSLNLKSNDMIVKEFISKIPSLDPYRTYKSTKECQTNLCCTMCSNLKLKNGNKQA